MIGAVNDAAAERDVVVCAAGSMPGDLHKLWRATDPDGKGYHVEYGYSCMGYELPGAMGVKLAAPEREVFAMVGDGSYLMLPGELATAVAERIKLVVVLVQNHGYASIGALSRSVGGAGYGTHYRVAEDGDLPVDDGQRLRGRAGRPRRQRGEPRSARAARAHDRRAARRAGRGARARRRPGRRPRRDRPLRGRAELRRLVGRSGRRGRRRRRGAGGAGRSTTRPAGASARTSPRPGRSAMPELRVPPAAPGADGAITVVTPESAGWSHVGFEALVLEPGRTAERDTGARECCVVVIAGHVHIRSAHGDWRDVGGRATPFDGAPDAAYLPPRTRFTVEGAEDGGEVGLCFAPAGDGARARLLPAGAVTPEARGHGAHARTVRAILMDDEPADALLVCEVDTPPGHWSSYPPHKHDRDALPEESRLEETYFFRVDPPQGFGIHRVYGDGLDETLAVRDRDTVLVPRGYHTVSAPPGYRVYYLNVMAGPARAWAVADDPDHAWTKAP